MTDGISRRKFVTTVAATGAGLTIVPRHVLGRGFQAPSDTVNVANRLEGMTRQYDADILLSRETIEAAESFQPLPSGLKARMRDLGTLPISGREAPVHVFAITRKV